MCWEPLACGPAIILTCDHACHLACAKEHLKQVPVAALLLLQLFPVSLLCVFFFLSLPCID